MSVFKKFAGQTLIYGISTIFSRLFNFILTPIFTRTYPAAAYGILTKMFSYASLINAILALGMETTYFRYLNKHEDQKQMVYNNTFFAVFGISVLFLITGLVFTDPITHFIVNESTASFEDQKLYVQIFIWLLFIDAITLIPFAKLRADNRPYKYSLLKFINIFLFVAFNLIFIYVIPALLEAKIGVDFFGSWYREKWIGYVFISNIIASVVTFLLLIPEFLQLELKFDKRLFKNMLGYSWPILVANLSFIINENLDKILLDKYSTETQVGIYGAVCKIAIFMSIFNTAFRLGAEPFFFSYAKKENAKQTYAIILEYFVIALALLLVGLVANIEILKYFISRDKANIAEYWSGLPAVPYLLLGYVCLGIYMNLSVWYRLSDQTKFGLYISLIGAFITITFNIILIPKYGYMASAWVSLATYSSMMIISYVLGQKYYPIPYKLKSISLYLISSIIIVWISFYVLDRNIYYGNLLFLMYAGFIYYLERHNLKKLIRS